MGIPVIGGPQDGAEVADAGTRYRWISDRGGHSKPAPGRVLYERKVDRGRVIYRVAIHPRQCPNCETIYTGHAAHLITAKCHLCGTATLPL